MDPWQGRTVLVVDDSDMIRSCLIHLFEEVGLTVVGEASNGEEALEMVDRIEPDLVSLDIKMPVMDGPACYAKIKQTNNSAKFLIVSCVGAIDFEESVMSASLSKEIFVSKLPAIPALHQALNDLFAIAGSENSSTESLEVQEAG
ncbi:response regulator [bacterium]|nr:response regulator [bacterium]